MTDLIKTVLDVGNRWAIPGINDEIKRIEADTAVSVGFLGDFASGKSTLINEMIGMDNLLPTGVDPCTKFGKIIAVEGLASPEFYQMDGNAALAEIGRPTFEDMVRGKVHGVPVAHIPARQSFTEGTVLVDTAGIGSIDVAHERATFSELSYLDAAVLCVDASKGGLSSSILTFLRAPRFRHLRPALIVAVTKADLQTRLDLDKIVLKIAADLAGSLGFTDEEAKQRVFPVSAGPDAVTREISLLHKAIETIVLTRRAEMRAERRTRAMQRLLPLAIRLLEQQRSAIQEPDGSFASRISELERNVDSVREVRNAHTVKMENLKASIRDDLTAVCKQHHSVLATETNTAQELEKAAGGFFIALEKAVQRHLRDLDASFENDVTSRGGDVRRMLAQTNKFNDFGKKVATSVILAALSGGTSVAANAGEAVGGAALQTVAAKVSVKAAAQAVARSVVERVGLGLLKTLNDVNPVNFVGDQIAALVKEKQLGSRLERLSAEIARDASQLVETFYEKEHFGPAERELALLKKGIETAQIARRADIDQRLSQIDSLETDIRRLRTFEALENA